MNSQKKGFSVILLILILVLVGAIGGGSYYYFKKVKTQPKEQVTTEKPKEEVKELTAEQIAKETADWKTYRNEKYGYEIKYPKEWFVHEEEETVYVSSVATSPSFEGDAGDEIEILHLQNEHKLLLREFLIDFYGPSSETEQYLTQGRWLKINDVETFYATKDVPAISEDTAEAYLIYGKGVVRVSVTPFSRYSKIYWAMLYSLQFIQ